MPPQWKPALELLLEAIAALRQEERELQSRLQHLRIGQNGRSTVPTGVGRLMEVRSLLQQMTESFQQSAAALGYQDADIRRAVAAARRRGALRTKPWQQHRR